MQERPLKVFLALLRYFMALEFLWAFFDKLLGLGYSTMPQDAWIRFGSPTAGFLTKGSSGPFAPFFNIIGGKGITDWLFMLALLFIGLALLLGIGMKIATVSGVILSLLMWAAALPKPNNLLQIDSHIVYALILFVLLFSKAGRYGGFGRLWSRTKLVKKAPGLE